MNRREKILASAVGGLVLIFAGVFGVKALLVAPLREIDKKTAGLRQKLETIAGERRAYFTAEDLVKNWAQRAFADELDLASARSGEMLTRQISRSGLSEANFSRTPVGSRKLRGATEIGWSVQGEGKLEDVIDLLFLLQQAPHLHRVENIAVSPAEKPGQVRIKFRYLTLVLQPAPIVEPIELPVRADLKSEMRQVFNAITTRDLLRPYIKRPQSAPATPPPSPAPPGPESFRIVSLSEWLGQPEVHVRDLNNQKTARYKPGDKLGEGTVVMVDYRSLPMPGNDALQSFSRVILKIDSEYWAIERGGTLADKYKLPPDKLPEELAVDSK